jgi:hypothetical protein
LRRRIAGDDKGVAIDQTAIEVERADHGAIGAERGHHEARRQVGDLVLAQRLAVAERSQVRSLPRPVPS